jgi:hypothetical protein
MSDFNKDYAEFLEKGHYGLDISIPEVKDYLYSIFPYLIKIPGFKYHQIKLKFNMARFYTNLYDILGPQISRIIEGEIEKTIDKLVIAYDKRESNNKG